MTIQQILQSAFVVCEVVLIFNLLIIVHEFGHFLAARWRGLHVDRFGIWFGRPIWKKKIGSVEYCIGWIPAGGYVTLPQLAPMDAVEGKPGVSPADLPPVAPLDKIIVAFAGPLFSFLLALVFATIVWIVGRPTSEAETTTVIGSIIPESAAAKAGFQVGDKVLEIDEVKEPPSISKFKEAPKSLTSTPDTMSRLPINGRNANRCVKSASNPGSHRLLLSFHTIHPVKKQA
jgi:regulator of sigma E protease